MTHTYKGHGITVKGAEIRPKHWDLHIAVMWSDGGLTTNKPFTITRRFDSLDEANTYGLLWVKNWIDGGKPNVPSRHF
jgi:hypothetical protein